eukprot:scaffold123013_cov21-Tisochrysis_lutea.AAC.1
MGRGDVDIQERQTWDLHTGNQLSRTHRLVLVHASIDEEEGWVVVGYNRARRPIPATANTQQHDMSERGAHVIQSPACASCCSSANTLGKNAV